MSRETVTRTTITCDADWCFERSTSTNGLLPNGWTLDYVDGQGVDLCPRCSKGLCAHAVGKDEYGEWCHCAEPTGHDGDHVCSHGMRRERGGAG